MVLDIDFLLRNFYGIIGAMIAFSTLMYYFRRDVSKLEEDIEKIYNDKIKLIDQEMLQFALNLSKKDKLDDDDKNEFIYLSFLLSGLEIFKEEIHEFIDELTEDLKQLGALTAISIFIPAVMWILPPEQDPMKILSPVVFGILLLLAYSVYRLYQKFREHRELEKKLNKIGSVKNISELEPILMGD